ncbi:MAG: hypothetical protein M0P91_05245 [Sulfuricurvum sp.]|jgi:hypothetical protein|uniref:hypothetical protein n=1 Tax=Sulfuricurvum sp. TaxID=2025608 RepID=UPI0025FA9EAF|nr:hypothetical protein [Sulfuricurvum sp.]MCK9372581.1 hypothetical protein [Sulfuricurvum sp.]
MKTMVLVIATVAIIHNGVLQTPGGDPFECDSQNADFLINNGYAEKVEVTADSDKDPLADMKIDDLKALAEQRSVTIPEGVTKKADIVAFLNSPAGGGEA